MGYFASELSENIFSVTIIKKNFSNGCFYILVKEAIDHFEAVEIAEDAMGRGEQVCKNVLSF